MDVTEANRRHFISSTESLVLVHWHKHMCLKIDTSFISGDIGPFLPCGLWPAGDFVWGARRLLAPLTEKGPLSSLIKLRGTRVGGQGLPVEPAPLRGQPPLPSRAGHGGGCADWLSTGCQILPQELWSSRFEKHTAQAHPRHSVPSICIAFRSRAARPSHLFYGNRGCSPVCKNKRWKILLLSTSGLDPCPGLSEVRGFLW